jgi:hypothetical protein
MGNFLRKAAAVCIAATTLFSSLKPAVAYYYGGKPDYVDIGGTEVSLPFTDLSAFGLVVDDGPSRGFCGAGGTHAGTDFWVKPDHRYPLPEIVAPVTGTVRGVDDKNGACLKNDCDPNYVMIAPDGDGDIDKVYILHLAKDSAKVKYGDKVERGKTVLGRVAPRGEAGNSLASHVHIELLSKSGPSDCPTIPQPDGQRGMSFGEYPISTGPLEALLGTEQQTIYSRPEARDRWAREK